MENVPSYRRTILPVPRTYVPRIVLPLKLEKHYELVVSQHDADWLPFCIAKYWLPQHRKFLYIHRKTGDIYRVLRMLPPQ